jgi:protein-tyrosine phosphatase
VQAEIAAALADGPVYLHCWSGGGRAHMATGIYLVGQEHVPTDECLRRIEELRNTAGLTGELPLNLAQCVFLTSTFSLSGW